MTIFHSLSATAHHGNTEFDLRVLVRYEGTVLEQRWMNPHSVMKLATRSQSGDPIRSRLRAAHLPCYAQAVLRWIRSWKATE